MRRLAPLSLLLVTVLSAQETPAVPAWRKRLQDAVRSPQAWQARKDAIRRQILVAAGLWPEFDRPTLRAGFRPTIYGKVEGAGFTVERMTFETWPGSSSPLA